MFVPHREQSLQALRRAAALNGIVAIFGPKSGFVDAALYAILGFAIRRKSRTAAIMALALLTLGILGDLTRL